MDRSDGFLVGLLISLMALILCERLEARNAVFIDCPVAVPEIADSIPLAIHFSNDDSLRIISIRLHYSGEFDLIISSVNTSESVLPVCPTCVTPISLIPSERTLDLSWFDLGAGNYLIPPQDSGLLCTIWFTFPYQNPSQCIDIDTAATVSGPSLAFHTRISLLPVDFFDCGQEDIAIGGPDCSTLNQPPLILGDLSQTIEQWHSFAPIVLDEHVTDESPDSLIAWDVYGSPIPDSFHVNISENRVAIITYPVGFVGNAMKTFEAVDPWGLRAIKYAQFKVTPSPCGDPDGSASVNVSDAVFLINYIFAGGPVPSPLLSGDADCSGLVNISDAVYLINYIFAGGSAPCATCP